METITIPFDGFVEGTVISSWVKTLDTSPLHFVVTLHPVATFIRDFNTNVCIFKDAAFQFLRWLKGNASMNTALSFKVAMGDVPIGFDCAAIVVRVWNQKNRPARTNEKNKYTDEVFVRRR